MDSLLKLKFKKSNNSSHGAVLNIHGKELGSILWRHWIKKKITIYPDLASTRFRIPSVFKKIQSGEWIQKVADSYAGFTEYLWKEAESRKKKVGIQKYLDTCERGLK